MGFSHIFQYFLASGRAAGVGVTKDSHSDPQGSDDCAAVDFWSIPLKGESSFSCSTGG